MNRERIFKTLQEFEGVWKLRNGRVITFTDDSKKLLLDVGSFPLCKLPDIWDEANGKSKISSELDIVERIREWRVSQGVIYG